jgi:hypothetical protein
LKFFIIFLLTFATASHAGVSGQLKSSTDYYPTTIDKEIDDLVPYLMLDLNGKNKLARKLRFQWHAFALGNLESESEPEQAYGDLPEAFVEWKNSILRMRLGMNTVNWGVVDVSAPSDAVNTQALFHPLRTYKRGAPMLEINGGDEAFALTALYIPIQQRPLMPSADSRWLPRQFLYNVVSEGYRVVVPETLEYRFLPPQSLDHALENNWGVRLTSHVGSLDLSAMHFEGAHSSPKARLEITAVPGGVNELITTNPIELTLVTYRVRTSGAGLVWARENWIHRLETAYQHTISEDELLQPWSWSSVYATETNVDIGSQSATLLFQYYYTVNPQAADNMISSSYRLFDRTPVLGFRYPLSDDVTATGSVLYETGTKSMFWMAGFDQKLSDTLRWGLGWRDFSAQEDGLIKTFEKNDHASMDLTYYF